MMEDTHADDCIELNAREVFATLAGFDVSNYYLRTIA